MTWLEDLRPGDRAYFVPSKCQYNGYEVVIARVGRKWIYTDRNTFHKDGRERSSTSLAVGRLWRSKEEFEARV